ncbi:K+/H+ antiporter subunit F [Xinfangfangia pollutisoli]|uniref:K+/H+ antiporter subunit F n=1 Tax=Xinfangfangia pollutisoli TaxID=2865960 RepID=UPI001CD68FAE|nr:K+/H+ antiporter subunit F [Xinfangfangia pollutisoli]
MLSTALAFAMGCFALALVLNLIRIATAPTLADRILALDTMTINVIALLMLYGARTGGVSTFEPAVLFAMTGFVATVAFCKYILRGSIIE